MLVYYSDPYSFDLPAGHRFPLAKYRLLRERLLQWPASSDVTLQVAPRATFAELELAHDPDYVHAFVGGRLDGQAMARIGFPWSTPLVERTLRSAGGTIAATRAVLRGHSPGGACYLAGGTHHARRDRGAGYCVFNDCAVAARVAQREFAVRRVLIVDTDVHQGDGTAALFAGDRSVFTFSIHGAQNFPAEKASSDLDVALSDRTGDAEFLRALARGLDESFARSAPQLVFYLSGADAHERDRLGRLAVTTEGLQERDRLVFAACRRARVPVVTVMGGGYGSDLRDTVDVYENTVRAAMEHRVEGAAG
ncbi:MAG: histone deacetylase [Planctomycetota bacterium]